MTKARLFWPLFLGVVVADVIGKALAVAYLPLHLPRRVIDDVVRFTLSYNQNAAFGLSLGIGSRWTFVVLAIVALAVLAGLYRTTRPAQRWQTAALALIAAGAVGNLIDRIRSPRGVVDFIDIGLGETRFWTFNIADAAITVGAIMLAVTLWRMEEGGADMAGAPPG
ncbi:MAG TPA: signal peptidase II [Longimicrobiales bacterium]|nr:signal peptidase II [Longimicrobiales bacterium]